jgi:hypothetical protein
MSQPVASPQIWLVVSDNYSECKRFIIMGAFSSHEKAYNFCNNFMTEPWDFGLLPSAVWNWVDTDHWSPQGEDISLKIITCPWNP